MLFENAIVVTDHLSRDGDSDFTAEDHQRSLVNNQTKPVMAHAKLLATCIDD